jgi:signal transduction histidine kinase
VGDQNLGLLYYKKAADANRQLGDQNRESNFNNNIGERYRLMGKYREAIPYYNNVLSVARDPYLLEVTESNLADVYTQLNDFPLAFKYAFSSLATARQIEDNEGIAWIDAILARIYLKKGMADSALYYAKEGLAIARRTETLEYIRDNAGALANAYAHKKDFANAYNYHLIYINYRDSMMNSEISNKSALLQYNYDLAKKQAQITTLDQQKKVQRNYLIGSLIVLAFIVIMAAVLLRNNRLKQRANQLLQRQKLELQDQRDQTNKALAELQQAQKQLVQSEKMASLGELTAGIAHEIQNPLNFVNNFAEINAELTRELDLELDTGNVQSATALARNLRENEEKVSYHGRRADAIVKSMLQHSRTSSGQKEPVNINALTDEYLRLSYHGMRAKDKAFNTKMDTQYDPQAGTVSVVQQDIGRVLLNLFNNAFYAVGEKKKHVQNGYEPMVWVSTRKEKGTIEICVKDNGMGISKSLLDKIFQPFFTTKAAGEGTGLGLSLSYDIIRAHGGELQVQSEEGKGTAFTILLTA